LKRGDVGAGAAATSSRSLAGEGGGGEVRRPSGEGGGAVRRRAGRDDGSLVVGFGLWERVWPRPELRQELWRSVFFLAGFAFL